MILFSIFISVIYSILIFLFIKGFHSVKVFLTSNNKDISDFSIIIPFRNESQNLSQLLSSICHIKYSENKFEAIFVNDQSDDNSVALIESFQNENSRINITIINKAQKSNSPKKDAIETAIKISKFKWIVTTDADCILPKNWLTTLDQFIQNKNPVMIVGPVSFRSQNTFLVRFQILDFLSLQGATIAGFGIDKPFLCNGANLCYKKSSFIEQDGFSGNDNIASGDDIFLLEKMVTKYPDQVKYLKSRDATVVTKAQENMRDLLHQRIRWASKTSNLNKPFGKWVGLIIISMNLYLIVLLLLAFFNHITWQHIGFVFILKFNLDFLMIYPTSLFFKQQKSLSSYFLSSILYPFFCVYVVILSFIIKYEWKGRKYVK